MSINTTKVTYYSTNKAAEALKWFKLFETLPLIACDFEMAIRYTEEQKQLLTAISKDESQTYLERRKALAVLAATALDHPVHTQLTHCSIAVNDREAYVFILDNPDILSAVLTFLVTTEVKQVWHNATFDFKHIYFHTGKMPINYECSAIFARTLFNHVDKHKAKVGLKELAGSRYGAWALSPDQFTLEQMYDHTMLLYAGTDACATYWIYTCMFDSTKDEMDEIRSTADPEYSPWDQLAQFKSPKGATYPEAYFYHNTGKHLVRDTVRFSMNGLPIDLDGVRNLELEIDRILEEIHADIAQNEYVQRYLDAKYKELVHQYKEVQTAKLKNAEDFLVEFDCKSAVHRSYYMQEFVRTAPMCTPEELLPSGVPKWSAQLVKKLAKTYPVLQQLVDKTVPSNSIRAQQAMQALAADKARMHNEKYIPLIVNPDLPRPVFNPGSAKQKQELFAMLGLESDAKSDKTGDDSWSREQIEIVNRTTDDDLIKALTQCLIDYSFAAIIKNTFVPAFYNYSIDGVLFGTYNLFGAKSMRFTSNKPNMLNTPSSRSRFSKPVKKCFIAPKGFIVATADYAALEDRVMANLSEDENKLAVFLNDIDGHSQAAYIYWPEEATIHIGTFNSISEAAIEFKRLVDEGHVELKELRNRGKAISFGLAYGCGAAKVALAAKISLEEAIKIFNAYHNELYPGVTKYREEYVLKTAMEQGYIHMGLGARIYTDDPRGDIRTLNNSTCQFWSILSLLTINKMHQLIDKAGYSKDIFFTSSIYDSVYLVVRDDPKIIKWLNDTLIPIMETQYMEGQILPNSVDLEIGPNWAELHKLPHNATVEEIKTIRKQW